MSLLDTINRLILIRRLFREKAIKRSSTAWAFLGVSRKNFIPHGLGDPYSLEAFDLTKDTSITCPLFVARMVELIDPPQVGKNNRVLEIGTGTGFQTAILAKLGYKVTSIERVASHHNLAKENLNKSKILNVNLICGDGSLGLKVNAPYDAIIMGCACPEIPTTLIDQLELGGKLVAPIGLEDAVQILTVFIKTERGYTTEEIRAAWFVPLISD